MDFWQNDIEPLGSTVYTELEVSLDAGWEGMNLIRTDTQLQDKSSRTEGGPHQGSVCEQEEDSQHVVSYIRASSSRMLRCVHKHWTSCLWDGHFLGISSAQWLCSVTVGTASYPSVHWRIPPMRSSCEHTNVFVPVYLWHAVSENKTCDALKTNKMQGDGIASHLKRLELNQKCIKSGFKRFICQPKPGETLARGRETRE